MTTRRNTRISTFQQLRFYSDNNNSFTRSGFCCLSTVRWINCMSLWVDIIGAAMHGLETITFIHVVVDKYVHHRSISRNSEKRRRRSAKCSRSMVGPSVSPVWPWGGKKLLWRGIGWLRKINLLAAGLCEFHSKLNQAQVHSNKSSSSSIVKLHLKRNFVPKK